MSAISVENLTYYYGPSKPALLNLSLDVPKGSRVLLIGANGAGKSTLLQVLAGKRMMPKGMKVTILGQDVFRNTPEARHIYQPGSGSHSFRLARLRVLHFSVLNGEGKGDWNYLIPSLHVVFIEGL